jgi:hypothetical protein
MGEIIEKKTEKKDDKNDMAGDDFNFPSYG